MSRTPWPEEESELGGLRSVLGILMDDQPYKARPPANLPPYQKASLIAVHLRCSLRVSSRQVALIPQ